MTDRNGHGLLKLAATGLALLAMPLGAQRGERPVSYSDSFPIGSNGLCEAQIIQPEKGTGMFDRSYAVVCRDAAAPVGRLWVVRGSLGEGAQDRFLPQAACQEGGDSLVPGTLKGGRTLSCREADLDTARVLAFGEAGGRTYAGQSIAAYADVVRLGLETLAGDRLVAGEVEIPLTQSSDAQAFARAQARAIAADAALAEAYRRSNSGAFADAAEFFAQTARTLSGPGADEARLNEALQQSNLGNFAAAAKIFDQTRATASANPVLARMQRNYEALNALNQSAPDVALGVLDRPLPASSMGADALAGLEIAPALAERLAAENPGDLETSTGLTALEREDLLDGQAEYLRATALRLQGRNAEAEAALARSDGGLAAVRDGRVASIIWLRAQVLDELGELREQAGDLAGAEQLHRRAITLLESSYPGSPALLSSRAQLAALMVRAGRRDEALGIYRDLVEKAEDKPAPALRRLLAPYFDLLAAQDGSQPVADLFYASQLLQRPGLAQTQAVLARELSGGSDEASQLFRQALNLARGVEVTRNAIAQLEASGDDSASAQERLAQRRAELDSLAKRQLAVQDKLAQYPRYRAVTGSRMALDELSDTLRTGEAYYKLVTLAGSSYGVMVTPDAARAVKLGMSPGQIERAVDELRGTIAVVENGETLTFPFDIAKSRELYRALFGPFDDMLGNATHLIFEPDGAMLRLPANLLVMDDDSVTRYQERTKGGKGDEYDFTGTRWLGRAMEVSTAVSPSAFRDVRAAPASAAVHQYLGLGQNEPLTRDRGSTGTRGGIAGGSDCLWAASIWDYPIKADELYKAAAQLGATGTDGRIITDAAFTDQALLGMNDLDQYRILHFATHGLVTAPQPGCPPRPALLTSFGEGESDGLLSFGEIFDLDLDADLVILSACDTAGQATVGATREAGVAGGGGFALDGLVRAFVGAGGRSIVASHWPVPDDFDATNRLISGFFSAAPGESIAGSLHDAQVALMDEADTSHPFYWSAFAIVGDGATALRR